jgi:hypothetical protein
VKHEGSQQSGDGCHLVGLGHLEDAFEEVHFDFGLFLFLVDYFVGE